MTTTTAKSLDLMCPHCGQSGEDVVLKLYLNDLGTVVCDGCDAEFSPRKAAEMLEEQAVRWKRVALWLSQAPTGGKDGDL